MVLRLKFLELLNILTISVWPSLHPCWNFAILSCRGLSLYSVYFTSQSLLCFLNTSSSSNFSFCDNTTRGNLNNNLMIKKLNIEEDFRKTEGIILAMSRIWQICCQHWFSSNLASTVMRVQLRDDMTGECYCYITVWNTFYSGDEIFLAFLSKKYFCFICVGLLKSGEDG